MAWRIEIQPAVLKELKRIGPEGSRRIVRFLHDRVVPLEDPRSLGEALHGPELGRFWKYRIGDYRVVAANQDATITILIVRVGHRREIYR